MYGRRTSSVFSSSTTLRICKFVSLVSSVDYELLRTWTDLKRDR